MLWPNAGVSQSHSIRVCYAGVSQSHSIRVCYAGVSQSHSIRVCYGLWQENTTKDLRFFPLPKAMYMVSSIPFDWMVNSKLRLFDSEEFYQDSFECTVLARRQAWRILHWSSAHFWDQRNSYNRNMCTWFQRRRWIRYKVLPTAEWK